MSKTKPLLFYTASILVLVLAITYGLTKTTRFKIQHLRSTLSTHQTIFHKILNFLPNSHFQNPVFNNNPCVLWMAPFLSGGGYSSEAWSYILALHRKNPTFKLAIEQHGDLESLTFWEGLPQNYRTLAVELHRTECRLNETVVVCHSEPGAWYPPLFETLPCPPGDYGRFKAVIGRTMFETDRVNPEHVGRCNRMDYVWVPSDFHVSSFVESGVEAEKVVKVVQSVDVGFFDPSKYEGVDFDGLGSLVLGEGGLDGKFVFLSVFKWEFRKGWDVLLEAYLREFSDEDGVVLCLLTNPYHTDTGFGNKIVSFVEEYELEKPVKGWAPVNVIDAHIAQTDLPRVYKAADAFVLPSRGEGWGRPIVEAMAMSMPVIATNWSGPVEYMTEENSYPLPVDRMSEVMEGPFKGHLWAEPSIDKLRVLMRHLVNNIEEGKARGRQAREDMIKRFSPEVVAGIVNDLLLKIL